MSEATSLHDVAAATVPSPWILDHSEAPSSAPSSAIPSTRPSFGDDKLLNPNSRPELDSPDDAFHPPPTPDGGYGWVCAAAVGMINAHTWGVNTSYGVFLAHYLADDVFSGATSREYAFVGSLNIGCAFLVSPVATACVGIWGTRAVMFAGSVLLSASLIAASFATEIWHLFLTQGVLFGIGMGLLFVPSAGIVPQWFTTKRSLANGISTSGSGLGGLVYSLATGAMIQSLGLAWAFRILGIVAFVANTVSVVVLRDRNKLISAKQVAFDTSLFRRVEFLLLLAYGCFVMMGYIVMIYSVSSYARHIGLGASQAALVTAFMNLGQAVGRPAVGFFSDHTGRINMAAFATLLSGLFALAIWTNASSYAVLVVFSILGGAMGGSFWTVIAPVTAEVVGLREVPAGLGLLWVVLVVPAVFSEPMGLEIFNGTGSYLGVQLFVGFMYIAAFVCLLLVRGWKLGESNEATKIISHAGEKMDRETLENDEDKIERCRVAGRKVLFSATFKSGKV